MKTLSDKYKNSVIGQTGLTLAYAVKFELANGTSVAFTSNSESITFSDEPDLVYFPNAFTPTSASKKSDMSVDTVDTDLIIDNEIFKDDDLEKGVYNGAKFLYFRYNYLIENQSYDDIEKIVDGTLGQVVRKKGLYTFELRSKQQYLQSDVGATVKQTCDAQLYDSRCGVNKNNHVFSDRVSSVYNTFKFSTQNLLNQTGDFNFGILEFTSGDASGLKCEVKSWTLDDKTIELQLPINYDIKSGDEFTVWRGCDKTKSTCINVFDNVLNFRGFSFVPGNDKLTSSN